MSERPQPPKVSAAHFWLMYCVIKRGAPVRMTEIRELSGLSKTKCVHNVGVLTRRGWLVRTGVPVLDSHLRVATFYHYHVSPAGRKLLADALVWWRQFRRVD